MKGVTEGMVMAATAWKNNAELIADCAKLGYLHKDWFTFDPTYGRGLWWKTWQPNVLHTSDDFRAVWGVFDFRCVPAIDGIFDAITFDPPYIAQGGRRTVGAGADDFVDRFGLDDCPATPALLQELINDGLTEMVRLLKPGGFLLCKNKDYISSGHLWPGTHHTPNHALGLSLEYVDRLEHIGRTGPQSQTRQVHARRNLSTLFVFRKARRRHSISE